MGEILGKSMKYEEVKFTRWQSLKYELKILNISLEFLSGAFKMN